MKNELAEYNFREPDKIWMCVEKTDEQNYIPATVKPDWRMPACPSGETCPKCGNRVEPFALNTGAGWYLGWQCSDGCGSLPDENGMPADSWPFVEEKATWRDLEKLGFTIEW